MGEKSPTYLKEYIMSDSKAKTVKVTPTGEHFVEETTAKLWGFDFVLEGKKFVCEMSEKDADANIEAGRVSKV